MSSFQQSLLTSVVLFAAVFVAHAAGAGRQMERLDRGLVATRTENGVFLSWRLLGDEPSDLGFHVYRQRAGQPAMRLNAEALTGPTCYLDREADLTEAVSFSVRAVRAEVEEEAGRAFELPAGAPVRPYLAVPLRTPEGYTPNDASVGDLDGNGRYEIVLHQAGRGRDNSQRGRTTEPLLEAYTLSGDFLWRVNLGTNIREGAHYTQFIVYDLDGDGRAEVACKTADGTVDGLGKTVGDASVDHRNAGGYVLEGPEFLTVFDGQTGGALATVDYVPSRGRVADWGDDYGNRVDRFLACVAYLDGERPSLVMCRGYYTRAVLAAWNWRDGELQHVWTFDSDAGPENNRSYRGQGNHGISVADVDGDERDEIVYGSCVIDDDGKGLYSTGSGHGDAMHVSDIDPSRPGLEVFKANGDGPNAAGIQLRDAGTGVQLFGVASSGRDGVGRACALDIDPRYQGMEVWGKGGGVRGLFSARGERIGESAPRTCNMGVWWDGDVLRELLDGVVVTKWEYERGEEKTLFDAAAYDCAANNGSKANPSLCADLYGDWREEIVARTRDGKELRIFTATEPAEQRLPTLMHDSVYRLGVVWQNVGYNQPAHTSYFLGHGMQRPPLRTPRTPEVAPE